MIPSHIYFSQHTVLSRLVMKFIVQYVVTKVCDNFFMDTMDGILCSCKHNDRKIGVSVIAILYWRNVY